MLTTEELNKLLAMEEYSFKELRIINDHLEACWEIQEEYGDSLPRDVDANLTADIKRIIERLKQENKRLDKLKKKQKIEKSGLTLVKDSDNIKET